MSLKDKVEGNELDLSLNELTEVPVKELAATPKATHLDLSCNRIQSLPSDFASLTHLVKIDLSRNKLTELPQNFGNLLNLQFLDLDRNELKNIPVSFCKLKNLRWLDLKDNPLEAKFKAVAGDCLDEKQCQQCAKKIVLYMQNIESSMEREKQKKLKELREKEAFEKAKIEKDLEQQRKLKKLEKERRKALSKAKSEEKMKQSKENMKSDNMFHDNLTDSKGAIIPQDQKGTHWCMWFLPLIFIVIAAVVYVALTTKDSPIENITFSDVKSFVGKHSLSYKKTFITFWKSSFIPFASNAKIAIMKNIHSIMIYISSTASKLELFLSNYF